MTETLDQSEIDALLSAVEAGEVEEDHGELQIFSRFRKNLENVEIRDYDFKRPERISKEQMRALQTLHETFARNFGAALTGFLRSIVEVGVSQVQQMTYSEFIDGLPNPTSFTLVSAPPLSGQLCLEISPLIIYPIIDRLLGGTNQDLFIPQRPMTVIEARLIRQILSRATTALGEAWAGVAEIEFSVDEMESNPQLVQIVPPNEVVVVIRFELKMSKRAGTMSVCIPFNVIEPIIGNLNAQSWFSPGGDRDETKWQRRIAARLDNAALELTAILAETTLTVADLRSLEIGDVITTAKKATEPIRFCVEGVGKYFGQIGQHNGNRAVQIVGVMKDNEERPAATSSPGCI